MIDRNTPLGAVVTDRMAVSQALRWDRLLRDPSRTTVRCAFFSSTFNCFQTAGPITRLPLIVMRFCPDERLESVMVDDGSFTLPGAQPPRCP